MIQTKNLKGYSIKDRDDIKKSYSKKGNVKYRFNVRFSPIEYQCWQELRSLPEGRNFYPEYPIGFYFVDFADPEAKIVIECDSKRYHQDPVKDLKRQRVIESLGWKVFRFTSSQILSNYYENAIIPKEESGYYQSTEEYQSFIEENKHRCIGCFFRSVEFKNLFEK